MAHFQLGDEPYNADGWGPPDSPNTTSSFSISIPTQISNIPFAPFSRSDKLGRIADWTRNPTRPGSSIKQNPSDSAFDFSGDDSFTAGDDDSSFRLVDNSTSRPHHHQGQNRPKFNPRWRT
ncbi:hypothetical protein P3L10_027762 [Capsicum annuum]